MGLFCLVIWNLDFVFWIPGSRNGRWEVGSTFLLGLSGVCITWVLFCFGGDDNLDFFLVCGFGSHSIPDVLNGTVSEIRISVLVLFS